MSACSAREGALQVSLQRFAAHFKTRIKIQGAALISCCRTTSKLGALENVGCLCGDCGYNVLQQYDAVVLPVVLRLLLHKHNPPLHLLPCGRFQNNRIFGTVTRPYNAVQMAAGAPRRPSKGLDGRLAVAHQQHRGSAFVQRGDAGGTACCGMACDMRSALIT